MPFISQMFDRSVDVDVSSERPEGCTHSRNVPLISSEKPSRVSNLAGVRTVRVSMSSARTSESVAVVVARWRDSPGEEMRVRFGGKELACPSEARVERERRLARRTGRLAPFATISPGQPSP